MPNKKDVVNLSFLALLELTSIQNTVPTSLRSFRQSLAHLAKFLELTEDFVVSKQHNADRQFDWLKKRPGL